MLALCLALTALFAPELLRAQGCLGLAAVPGEGPGGVALTTGSLQLDAVLTREHTWAITKFRVAAALWILDDSGAPNAFASPSVSRQSYRDGSVMIGVEMMSREFRKSDGVGTSIPAVLAHEFAHILQFKNGVTRPGVRTELQADYLAGWYMGDRQRDFPASVSYMTNTFFELGDDYEFNDPSHHGTPKQRAKAFRAGFDQPRVRLAEAFRRSARFVDDLLTASSRSSALAKGMGSTSGFTDSLRQVVDLLDGNPNQLKGKRHPPSDDPTEREMDQMMGRRAWDAKIQLPGAVACTIESLTNPNSHSYGCGFGRTEYASEAEARFDEGGYALHSRLPHILWLADPPTAHVLYHL